MPEPSVVLVFEFEIFDAASRSWRVADRIGTLEAIAALGGIPLRATGLVVDRDRLDEKGFLAKTRSVV